LVSEKKNLWCPNNPWFPNQVFLVSEESFLVSEYVLTVGILSYIIMYFQVLIFWFWIFWWLSSGGWDSPIGIGSLSLTCCLQTCARQSGAEVRQASGKVSCGDMLTSQRALLIGLTLMFIQQSPWLILDMTNMWGESKGPHYNCEDRSYHELQRRVQVPSHKPIQELQKVPRRQQDPER
jgi:hypothetical protein